MSNLKNFLGAYSGGQKRGQNLVLIRVVGAYSGGAYNGGRGWVLRIF